MKTRFFTTGDAATQEPEAVRTVGSPAPNKAHRDPKSEVRLALLIGNARYTKSPLVNPIEDVRLLGDVLASLGFAVDCAENVDKAHQREVVAGFAAKLEAAGPNAVALFYFAGHGMQDGGINFLLPIDLQVASKARLRSDAIAVDEVVSQMAHAPRKANVIVLDACRTPPAETPEETPDMTQGLAALNLPPDGMLVVYSTASGARAEDGKSRNSPYAAALAQALPGVLTPDRRLHDVFVEAAERVRADTDGRQNPALYLQGTLPPLEVSDADRERFQTWVFRSQKTWRERAFQWVGIAAVLVAVVGGIGAWVRAQPEERGLFLHRLHIVRQPALYTFNCMDTAGERDRFGLTRKQWCEQNVRDLVPIVKEAGNWDRSVLARLDSGDPAAMTLHSADIALTFIPATASYGGGQALQWAARAASVGWLPAWPEVQRNYRSGNDKERLMTAVQIVAGLEESARAGVLAAALELARVKWNEGETELATQLLKDTDVRDGSGRAAHLLADLLLAGSPKGNVARNYVLATFWLKKACMRGVGAALDTLDGLSTRKLIAFNPAERANCVERVIAAGGPYGQFLRGLQLTAPGPRYDPMAAATALQIAAKAGMTGAMVELAQLHINDRLGQHSKPMEGLSWLRNAAKRDPSARAMLGETLAWGMPDASGKPRIPVDLRNGLTQLREALSAFDPIAGLALARLHETGAFRRRDPNEVLRLATLVRNSGGGLESVANDLASRAAYELKLNLSGGGQETIVIGKPDAPTRVVVMVPWGCSGCVEFIRETLPLLVRDYVKTGAIRLVVRPIYAGATVSRSAVADAFLNCAWPDRRIELFAQLLETYSDWSILFSPDAKVSRLSQLAAPFSAQPNCRPSKPMIDLLRLSGPRDAERWGIAADLVVAVNGVAMVRPRLLDVRRAIYFMAGPHVRPKLVKP